MAEKNKPQPVLGPGAPPGDPKKHDTESSGTDGPADEENHTTDKPSDEKITSSDGMHKKNTGGKKTMWVTIFRCFECGKHGHDLPKCRQCNQAYYCNSECQRKHWRKHRPVCRATVAALARRATRERLARAVREGKGKVEGAEDDGLCVICQAKPVGPVEVRT